MKLRSLIIKDATYMLEFINDYEISFNFKFTRYQSSIENFEEFIKSSWNNRENIHFAIEHNNEYAGTVSLKNVNYIDKTAEYAILVRKKFWGSGIAKEATSEIIKYGFNTLNLRKIYLNVISSNERAKKFYKKVGFEFEGIFKQHIFINGKYLDLNWYCIFNKKE